MLVPSLRQNVEAARCASLDITCCPGRPVTGTELGAAAAVALGLERPVDEAAPGRAAQRAADRPPCRILLVEDNITNQQVALGLLARLGYQANLATNGQEALTCLEQSTYDLVLLDLQMPVMDGWEAARRICARWPPERRPRLIALTAAALPGDREACVRAGMDRVLHETDPPG